MANPKMETGNIPVRFVGVGPYSLDVEVVAYINTTDYDEFLALQQELLLRMLQGGGKSRDSTGSTIARELQIAAGRAGLVRELRLLRLKCLEESDA
jgi:hypothetical protein